VPRAKLAGLDVQDEVTHHAPVGSRSRFGGAISTWTRTLPPKQAVPIATNSGARGGETSGPLPEVHCIHERTAHRSHQELEVVILDLDVVTHGYCRCLRARSALTSPPCRLLQSTH
jgi:hypothetical protein